MHWPSSRGKLDATIKLYEGDTPFRFRDGDHMIFSSSIIPVPVNILARERMDARMRKAGVKIQSDVHVHGHGSREDMREMIRMTNPKHVIPSHGSFEQEKPFMELSKEFGYESGKTAHLSGDGNVLKLK